MSNVSTNLEKVLATVADQVQFSGAVTVKRKGDMIVETAYGYSNRSEEMANSIHTRFGIASGCKLFTAIAICQLVEQGVISFDTKLKDCLNVQFPHFDPTITIHHLLTHSSGVPDYFDEEVMDDFEDLWKEQPMYLLKELKDFIPMFQQQPMKFQPGERFHYNNTGFILLGLIIEQQSGLDFSDYIERYVFNPSNMADSGYFSLDRLPKNTALGYIDEEDGTWRTNAYSIPIKGGADGGAYITAPDMIKLWEALIDNKLLNEKSTKLLLHPHIIVNEEDEAYYGYGVWIEKRNDAIFKYHVMGYDPGVNFHSAIYPHSEIILAVPSNKGGGAYQITKGIEEALFSNA